MVKKFFHKKSKRQTCKNRYKIEKKVKDHNKKLRKIAKKNPNKNKHKKDPGVPNSLPFKEAILQEAQRRKQEALDLKQKLREERKNSLKSKTLDDLKKDAEERDNDFEEMNEEIPEQNNNSELTNNFNTKTFYKEFRKVVDSADVILQVLDARDPLGSRCPQVEQSVLDSGPNKRLVLVLNKIDLIPKANLQKWLKYLRNEFPTVAFKASTQMQNQNLSRGKMKIKTSTDIPNASVCFGADMLLKLLGNYCRNKGIRTSIRVGVVGFPNVGKSSLINSLKRSKACGVGATPGFTKSVQTIQLDKHITLLDSPGVVMASGNSDDVSIALKNAVKVETLEDPVTPCKAILQRASKEQMMLHFRIGDFDSVDKFLHLLATKRGMLKKGGTPDFNKAAKVVINDWNTGKIKYYTHPPENAGEASHISAQVVSEMSKEFDIEAIISEEKNSLVDLQSLSDVGGMIIDSSGPTNGQYGEDDNSVEEEMIVEDSNKKEAKVTVSVSKKQKKELKEKDVEIDKNLRANSDRKKDYKKMLRKRKRNDKLAGVLSNDLLSKMELDSSVSYDFSADYK